ncbi:MAG: heavy metal response regulator transcription factor [Proteobacteria bacterium]|nr:heavy metal response regulator transcription factor [Pseudomonadota bacterium]
MHILIVEDEKKTTGYLEKGLKENNFNVIVAHDGIEGAYYALNYDIDLIVLDVKLPKMTGWDVITRIRKEKKSVPVIFLTARDSVEDRVKGLELGADDYLIKPFAFSELLARIRTQLKKTHMHENHEIISVEDLEIDCFKYKVNRAGKNITLTKKEFSLLLLLARRQGELLSRTYIAEQVWNINYENESNVIDVSIRRLRQKIDDGHERKLIHTLRGLGYKME